MSNNGILRLALIALLVVLVQGTWVLAGTTGSIEGKVTDQSGNGIAGAKVTAASPSQHANAVTVTSGFYSILDLSPDTYSVTTVKDGYDTATVYGITVNADQATAADIKLKQTVKTLGHITTTATASVVSKTVTGDLYAVNAKQIANANGASGGAETLYSQNSITGTLPGVNRFAVGTGSGYGGQGQLSIRGGSPDQVGYELDGIPLNRGFDFFNGTSFNTNGLASLEVYTGGAPADSGRAMSGYINEVIARGKYPGGADFTGVIGSPLFNHTAQADVYGATPDNHFSWYVSTLATNNYVNFGDRSNLANTSFTVPAGDAGCAQFNKNGAANGTTGGTPLNCSQSYILNQPVGAAQGNYAATPFNAGRDTATNLHWSIAHNGLTDDLQALYVVGSTVADPYAPYGVYGADPSQATLQYSGTTLNSKGQTEWPTGGFYKGAVGQSYNPGLLTPLTWPTSGGSLSPSCATSKNTTAGLNNATGLPFCGGTMPSNFQDSQSTQYSIEKLAYTHSLSQSSFLRIYGYQMYSAWTLDQPINGFIGFSFYQLHDNASGSGFDYQNQLNAQNLIKVFGDWSRDVTLRYNYAPQAGTSALTCATGGASVPCGPGTTVTGIGIPFSTWNTLTPLDWDGIISDTFKPNDKMQFDIGLRWDQFLYQLMPQQITGTNGLAYQSEEGSGQCLDGYAYSPSDPKIIGPNGNQNCFQLLQPGAALNPGSNPVITPGGFNWQNPPSSAGFTEISPRFGATFNVDPRDVIRLSVGRYVQPPTSSFQQYTRNPAWGPGAGTSLLNGFMTGLGFQPYHDILPEDSTNYDISFEHEFNGGYSAKLTPYYRDTRNQILSIPFNPQNVSFVTGDNFGNAQIKGFEFTLQRPIASARGIGGIMNATFTNSKIRFNVPRGGTTSFIDVLNGTNAAGVCQGTGICGYNTAYNTHFALLDPNGLYSPSFVMAPTATTPSYDVAWTINVTPEVKEMGFDFLVPFAYSSGSPYGDALQFPDPHCAAVATPGCIPVPTGINPSTGKAYAYYGGNGPDPYTKTFDGPGSLKGPSFWTLGLTVSHSVGHNLIASILGTNLLVGVHNQGYAWEQPSSQNNATYADNTFYSAAPLGAFTAPGLGPNPATGYYGTNYYPYSSAGTLPYRDWIFSLSAKL